MVYQSYEKKSPTCIKCPTTPTNANYYLVKLTLKRKWNCAKKSHLLKTLNVRLIRLGKIHPFKSQLIEMLFEG